MFVRQTRDVFEGLLLAKAQKGLDEAGKALVGYDAVPTS